MYCSGVLARFLLCWAFEPFPALFALLGLCFASRPRPACSSREEEEEEEGEEAGEERATRSVNKCPCLPYPWFYLLYFCFAFVCSVFSLILLEALACLAPPTAVFAGCFCWLFLLAVFAACFVGVLRSSG